MGASKISSAKPLILHMLSHYVTYRTDSGMSSAYTPVVGVVATFNR